MTATDVEQGPELNATKIDPTTLPFMVLDLEATGTNPFEDRIVEASLVTFRPGARPDVQTWLANPGVDSSPEAIEVHGITNEHARAWGQNPETVVSDLVGLIALWLHRRYPLVVFNAAYDLTMLEAEARRHDVPSLIQRRGYHLVAPIIDPMVMCNFAEPFRKKACACGCGATTKDLAGWAQHYRVPLIGAHGSAGDATAAGRLWPRILTTHPKRFRGYTLAGLHAAQADWRLAYCDRLRQWFDDQGEEHDGFDGRWPILLPDNPLTGDDSQPTEDELAGVPEWQIH